MTEVTLAGAQKTAIRHDVWEAADQLLCDAERQLKMYLGVVGPAPSFQQNAQVVVAAGQVLAVGGDRGEVVDQLLVDAERPLVLLLRLVVPAPIFQQKAQ